MPLIWSKDEVDPSLNNIYRLSRTKIAMTRSKRIYSKSHSVFVKNYSQKPLTKITEKLPQKLKLK